MAQQKIVLQPNATQAVAAVGLVLSIISASAKFSVEMDNQGQNVAQAGSALASQTGKLFRRLVFTETQGVANTILFDAGMSASPATPTAISAGAPTFPGPNSGTYDFGSSGAGFNMLFPGVDSQQRHRKIVYVTNSGRTSANANSSSLLGVAIAGSPTNPGVLLVQPNSTQQIETDANLYLVALNANFGGTPPTSLMGLMLEIFYTNPIQN